MSEWSTYYLPKFASTVLLLSMGLTWNMLNVLLSKLLVPHCRVTTCMRLGVPTCMYDAYLSWKAWAAIIAARNSSDRVSGVSDLSGI